MDNNHLAMPETQGSKVEAGGATRGRGRTASVNAAATVAGSGGTRLTKKGFGQVIGVSPGRVTQMIAQGLPVEADGKIDLARGRDWYVQNIDGRGKPPGDLFQAAGPTAKEERDFHDARLRKMKADQLAGDLVDRRAVERAIFGRARAERDAWLAFVDDAALAIAIEMKLDETAIAAILKPLVKDQLKTLAERRHADDT
ncbi:MAG: hypothetical protein KAG89_12230 [Fulvimarina manganoxydans]|uniref:hypothetical protein n=1 Tax=Fulvimarina manganoxydans TaxID=937218 RepID=UPI00235663B2|nr:hypothetical protein [Fulvimarina manganoxydans]MCK5932926.1 hypothetical protein [Fulvimarina manganoxydans]